MNIHAVIDLLLHFPLRYEDRTHITPIAELRPGEKRLIQGTVQQLEVKGSHRRQAWVAIADASGTMDLRYFHFATNQQAALQPGTELRCFGEVRQGRTTLEMIHPDIISDTDRSEEDSTLVLTPVYPTTEGLSQHSLRQLVKLALTALETLNVRAATEVLPPHLVQNLGLPTFDDAIRFIHQPPQDTCPSTLAEYRHPAQMRLIVEELIAHQAILRKSRARYREQRAVPLPAATALMTKFEQKLAFTLTDAQRRVIQEIQHDLALAVPMLRLLLGDVGAGKTVVAACSALQAQAAGVQTAFLAPTELLAEQHYATLCGWFSQLGVTVYHLTSRATTALRELVLQQLVAGTAHVVVGTHALLQDDVTFANLGLVIIDEQHRFGVQQRLALVRKRQGALTVPHQLIMTATPIPRSLALTRHADLDLSVLDGLPPGRQPVRTSVVPQTRRTEVLHKIAARCRAGQQAYWVCTLIDESETLQCQAAIDAAKHMAEQLPDVKVGLLHGKMRPDERDNVMNAFKDGTLGLLVATTVIEVGVDVPNASLMIIENAERLGLAQLHQLRGRVGRDAQQSDCVLMYRPPLSPQAHARLAILREASDGFAIAEADLAIRGQGEMLGTRQAGVPRFRLANPARDAALLPVIASAAEALACGEQPGLELLQARWLRTHRPAEAD